MLTTVVPEPAAWLGPSLAADRYLMPIPATVLAELDGMLAELRRAPVPTLLLQPEHFPLAACGRWMADVRRRLDEGPGFAVFEWDGRLRTRFNARHIVRGYKKTGRTLDSEGAEAVRLMDGFLSDSAHRLDLWLERGQIQVLNNRVIVHGRTPYEDDETPARRRHLVRLWLRAGDRRHFRG